MPPDSASPTNIGIFGASARAAAFSAIRSGLTPFCWDLFADRDLTAAAEVERIDNLADETLLQIPARRDLPIVYAGGMENYPRWVKRAGDSGVLWGNPESVVRNIRNPVTLAETMASLRLPVLEVRASENPPDADGTWLLKPRSGAGGRGIVVWSPEAKDHPTLGEPHYFQRRVEGESYSAVFIGREPPGDVGFVGITRQLVGWGAMHAAPFTWCGSVGPSMLPIPCEHMIRRIGNVLMWKFQLRGLYGCDFIVDEAGTPWLTEVNPRYPASAEIFELACGFTLLKSHATAFGADLPEEPISFETSTGGMVGKGVLFANADVVMPELAEDELARPERSLGRIADAPSAGSRIYAGQPVCSFLVEADSEKSVLSKLQEATSDFESRLRQDQTPMVEASK